MMDGALMNAENSLGYALMLKKMYTHNIAYVYAHVCVCVCAGMCVGVCTCVYVFVEF